MIRKFEKIDERRINANEFSGIGDMGFVFDDDDFYKQTLVGDDSKIYAIICFKRYWENNYIGFLLISEDIQPRHCVEIKKFIHNVVIDFNMDRLQTDSVKCDTLTRWHEFLGFSHEGTREKMIMYKDYDMWAMLKGRDF